MAKTNGDAPEPLFTFAVVADTHINDEENDSVSPWDCNKKANARARWIVSDVNMRNPAFLVHLGDFVHPVPSLPSYSAAARRFKAILKEVECPVHLVPGNHDVGDKPAEWMPAGIITEGFIQQYRNHFGADYFMFRQGDIEFYVINCQLLNSGLQSEARQREWLESELAGGRGGRKFLFTHYPLFICREDEEGHYDNIDEPGRSWLLDLVTKNRVEGVFAGHVHNFFFNRTKCTAHYSLPSTAFVRHDFSELMRIRPESEFGRDDVHKLGYMLVDVYPNSHEAHVIRSFGAECVSGLNHKTSFKKISRPSKHSSTTSRVMLDLRSDWTEVARLPYNGALDEFVRKEARNDYTLLALNELGVRHLRIPTGDLFDRVKLDRIKELRTLGYQFHAFRLGVPTRRELNSLVAHGDLIDSIELVLPNLSAAQDLSSLANIRLSLKIPLFVSWLRTSASAEDNVGSTYYHFVKHGFLADETALVDKFVRSLPRSSIDGIVFRVDRNFDFTSAIERIESMAMQHQFKPMIQVCLADDNPAVCNLDEYEFLCHIVEIVVISSRLSTGVVCVDSFVDTDRGYFPHLGLIDRRFNPKRSAKVFASLSTLLVELGDIRDVKIERSQQGTGMTVSSKSSILCLFLPADKVGAEPPAFPLPSRAIESRLRLVDLEAGDIIGDNLTALTLTKIIAEISCRPLAVISVQESRND